jgi:hypothetical protein
MPISTENVDLLVPPACVYDEGDVVLSFNDLSEIDAVHAGHLGVGDDTVLIMLLEGLHGVGSARDSSSSA